MADRAGIPARVDGPSFALNVKTDPFNEKSWATTRHAVGVSVGDALTALGLANDSTTQVWLEGVEIPPDKRGTVFPKEGRVAQVEPTPGGPAAGAALAVVSFFSIPYIYASALVVAGILWDTRSLLDRVFGTHRGQPGRAGTPVDPSGRNRARLYETVPVVLGRRRIVGDLGMQPHAELDGNNAYFNTLIVWGHAPSVVEDIQIGNDPTSAYQVTIQNDFEGTGGIKFVPRVDDTPLNVTLSSTPYETQTDHSAEYITMEFRGYPYAYTTRSEEARSGTITDYTYYPYSRVVTIEYRKQGASEWLSGGTVLMGDTTTYTIYGRRGGSRPGSSTKYFRLDGGPDPNNEGRRLPLENAIYEVRVSVGPVSSGAPSNATTGGTTITMRRFSSRVEERPVTATGIAMSSFRIFVPEGTSASVDEINAIVGIKVPLFQPSLGQWGGDRNEKSQFWTSTNPADLFRAVLASEDINARPLPLSFIDDDNLAEWWRFCDAEGFTYSKITTGRETRQDLLGEIAKAGRALPRMSEGKWGVTINKPVASPTQLFTPRNTDSCVQNIELPIFPDGLRVAFDNEEADWEEDELVVYDDGFAKQAGSGNKKATILEQANFPGVTNARAAYKLARYVLATGRLRPRAITLEVGYQFLSCSLGDRVTLMHDTVLSGHTFGRVVGLSGNVSYGTWSAQSETPNLDNFDTFSANDGAGIFAANSTGAPLGAEDGGAYFVRISEDAYTQYQVATFGENGKAIRSRTRVDRNSPFPVTSPTGAMTLRSLRKRTPAG